MKNTVIKKTLRLGKEDADLLCRKAEHAGMTENGYLRMLIRGNPAEIPQIHGLIKTLINEVNHIGVNVNQIARNSNAGYFSGSDRQQLLAYMQKLNAEIEQVVRMLGYQ